MIPRGRGKIINIASLQSEAARPGIAPYTASKGAVKMLTKGMCARLGAARPAGQRDRPRLFRDAAEPGAGRQPGVRRLAADGARPAGRWGRVEELQGAAVFLASEASDFVNGQIIYVDGGVLAVL